MDAKTGRDLDAAVPFDTLRRILEHAAVPDRVGRALNQEVRRLSGARLVVLVPYPGSATDEPIAAPDDCRELAGQPAISAFLRQVHEIAAIEWRDAATAEPRTAAMLAGANLANCLVLPLLAADCRVATLVVFDTPPATDRAALTRSLESLSRLLGPIWRNAALHRETERRVAQRTAEVRQVAQELRDAEVKYRLIAQSALDWVLLIEPDGRLVYCSPSSLRVTGYAAEEFIGDAELLPRIVDAEDQPLYRDHRAAELAQHGGELELRIRHRDGSRRWLKHDCQAIRSRDGRLQATRVTLRDVTGNKLAERALRESEANFETLVRRSPVPQALYDAQGNVVLVNDHLTATYGYTREDVPDLAHFWPLAFPDPTYRAAAQARWLSAVAEAERLGSQDIAPADYLITCKDGSVKATEAFGTRVGDAMLVVLNDVSERRRVEADLARYRAHLEQLVDERTVELRRRQERLELVLEASNTGLWQWDPVSHAIEFSPTYYTMLGYAPGEFAADQETWPNLVHSDDWPMVYRVLYDAAHSADDVPFSFEFRMRAKAGDWRWLQGRGRIVERDGEGRVRRVVGVNNDITERKWSESHERLRSDILEKLARGLELPALLDALVRGVEAEHAGSIASILLVDDHGRLRMGAAPSLPQAFCAAVDGQPIGDGLGSCGTAAFRGERVVVADIQQHPYWQGYRDLAADAGVAACWSQPVFDARGAVVATFAMYARTPRLPDARDEATLTHAANLASIAIDRHREEKKLQMAMQALETTRECVYWLDRDGRMLYVNPATEQELGYTAAELRTMTIPDIDPNTPAALWGPEGELTRRLTAEGMRKVTTLHRHRDGRLIPVEVDSDAFHYDGQTYFIAIARDISGRLAAEEALRKSEAKFAAMFNLTPEPMALTRLDDGVVLELSRSYAEYFGYQPAEIVGRSTLPGDLGLWLDAGQRRLWREKLERDGEVLGFETPLRRKDGTIMTVLISARVVEIGGERCVIVDIHDITAQKQHAEHLDRIAHHDALTGLPNRLLLGDRLRQAIAQNQRAGTRVAVCYLDLDGFKEVNDRLGHQAGDRLLVEVAQRLTNTVRGGDTVARLGGDEFVVLLTGLADDEECRAALDRLLEVIARPYAVGDNEHAAVSASVGVTVFPSDRVDPDTLVRHADHAMYAAKQAGKNRYQMFDTHLEQRIEARHATLRRVAAALDAGQFVLHYQPKVDCRQGRVVGVEALIRWQHPTLGLLPPAEFLPLIEDTDLALPVGAWVVEAALGQIVRWRREGIDLCVSVNAFVRQLLQPGYAASLESLLGRYPGVLPRHLQIEIVETAALRELEAIREVIEACQGFGVAFALDDFGTGYSTLAYIRHLPAQVIKIDQSFVRNMLVKGEDQAIVEAVIGLSRAFGRAVVAEGAETPAHVAQLLALGCDVMQGYALARPMPAGELPHWLGAFRPDPSWALRPGDIVDT